MKRKGSPYFSRQFPTDLMVCFLTRNGRYPLKNREITLEWLDEKRSSIFKRYKTLPNPAERDAYLSSLGLDGVYSAADEKVPLMFRDARELRDYLIQKRPQTIHVGPVWPNIKSRREERRDPETILYSPLVFDVDMDDETYDRSVLSGCTCPKGSKRVCDVCWVAYMTPSMLILIEVLRDTWGFKKLLVVFSGRRGFHVWVLDARVWALRDDQRKAIVSGITKRSPTLCTQTVKLLRFNYQMYFGTPPESDSELIAKMPLHLDENVTCDVKHTLKLPLNVHHTTQNIAVPIGLKALSLFRPSGVPSVWTLTKNQMVSYINIIKAVVK